MIIIESLDKKYDSSCQRWIAINPEGDFNPKDVKLPDYITIEDLKPPDWIMGFG
jgi:hypothetical protein